MIKTLPQFMKKVLLPYKGYVLASITTSLYYGITQSLNPYLIKIVIDALNDGAPMMIVYVFTGLYLAALSSQAANFRLAEWIHLQLFPSLRMNITSLMYDYLRQHSHRFFQSHFGGGLANKISDMNNGLISLLRICDEAIGVFFGVFVGLGFMYAVNPIFAAILLIWVVGFTGISYLFSKKIQDLSQHFSETKTTLVGHMVDAITNMINVWLFARHQFEKEHLDKELQTTVIADRKMQWQVIKLSIAQDVLIIVLIIAMFVGLLVLYQHNKVTLGDFTFILMLSISINQGMWWIARQMVQLAEELGKCRQALTILQVPHELVELPGAKPLIVSKAQIDFENVKFHHKGNSALFENLSLTIRPGEKVGLVGYSGSGKTTFTYIILRFFDVTKGRVLIDGQDIMHVTLDSLRSNIAMIPQDTVLFHRTLMDNIRYGRVEATDEEVIAASIQAECHDFITAMPEGYQALVGERGIKLSGGQRQRIAIARAILKDAPILILDEATSALDSVTEKKIQKTLYKLMAGRTTLVIAHRLSTLYKMDRILVFDKGKVIESGNHTDLINQKGHYANMWDLQAGGFLPEKQKEAQ